MNSLLAKSKIGRAARDKHRWGVIENGTDRKGVSGAQGTGQSMSQGRTYHELGDWV